MIIDCVFCKWIIYKKMCQWTELVYVFKHEIFIVTLEVRANEVDQCNRANYEASNEQSSDAAECVTPCHNTVLHPFSVSSVWPLPHCYVCVAFIPENL